jgi:hypothetical protein
MKIVIKMLVILVALAVLSIPFFSYANPASLTDGDSNVTCKVKGYSIHPTHLQVFVDIRIDQDVHFTMPMNKISDAITIEITKYRIKHKLERFDDVTVTIMKISVR